MHSRRRRPLHDIFLIIVAVSVAIILGAALGAAFVVLRSGGGTNHQITLVWDASTSPNVGGYRVHYGLSSGNYPNKVFVGNQTSYTLFGLDGGRTYYIAVTALEANGTGESDFSNEVVEEIPEVDTNGNGMPDTLSTIQRSRSFGFCRWRPRCGLKQRELQNIVVVLTVAESPMSYRG